MWPYGLSFLFLFLHFNPVLSLIPAESFLMPSFLPPLSSFSSHSHSRMSHLLSSPLLQIYNAVNECLPSWGIGHVLLLLFFLSLFLKYHENLGSTLKLFIFFLYSASHTNGLDQHKKQDPSTSKGATIPSFSKFWNASLKFNIYIFYIIFSFFGTSCIFYPRKFYEYATEH